MKTYDPSAGGGYVFSFSEKKCFIQSIFIRGAGMDLNQFFQENNRVALAFSGGVDSSYLLYAAIQAGADDEYIIGHGGVLRIRRGGSFWKQHLPAP